MGIWSSYRKLKHLSLIIVSAMALGFLLPSLLGATVLASLRHEQMVEEISSTLDERLSLLTRYLSAPVWNYDTRSAMSIGNAYMLDAQVVRISVFEPDSTQFISLERPERRTGNSISSRREMRLDNEIIGYVEVEVDDSMKVDEAAKDRRSYYLLQSGQFALALALAMLVVRLRILDPLARLSDFSAQLARGDLEKPIGWQQPDEIGRLASQMDQMRIALRSSFKKQCLSEKKLEKMAHFDALTRLPNRVLLANRIYHAMAQAPRREETFAVLYLDVDGFKQVNDSHGHEAGDLLLISLADRMSKSLREGDTLARVGGDEFVFVLINLSDRSTCEQVMKRLLSAVSEPVLIDGHNLQVSASLGATFYPQRNTIDADGLIVQADKAMYQAKNAGKNRFHFFESEGR